MVTEDGVQWLGDEGSNEEICLYVKSFLNEDDKNLSSSLIQMDIEPMTSSSSNKLSNIVQMTLVDDEEVEVIAECEIDLARELKDSAIFGNGCIVGLTEYEFQETNDGR